jgi:hypothetical protein
MSLTNPQLTTLLNTYETSVTSEIALTQTPSFQQIMQIMAIRQMLGLLPTPSDRELITDVYVARVAGTGYSAGDKLAHVLTLDVISAAIVSDLWINLNTQQLVTPAPALIDLGAPGAIDASVLNLLDFMTGSSNIALSNQPTRLFSLAVTNRTTTDLVLMLFDSVPIANNAPIAEYALLAGTSIVLDDSHFGVRGQTLTTGGYLALSTTAGNFTPFAVASRQDVIGSYRYIASTASISQ